MALSKEEIKELIRKSKHLKYGGVAPEGFVLIPEKMLEKLKDFEVWKEWKDDPDFLTNFQDD